MGVKTNMVCYTPRYSKCKRPREYDMSLDIGKTLYQACMIFNARVHTNLPLVHNTSYNPPSKNKFISLVLLNKHSLFNRNCHLLGIVRFGVRTGQTWVRATQRAIASISWLEQQGKDGDQWACPHQGSLVKQRIWLG